jgi:hypothetical protein
MWDMQARIPMEERVRYPFHFTYRFSSERPPPRSPRQKELRAERNREVQEAAKWCIDTFGRSRDQTPTNWRWTEKDKAFFFRYENDAFLFRLRWC